MRKFSYICILLLLVSFSGYCQILDDSTKLIYSAKTTEFFTLEDVQNNTNRRSHIDTSLINLHNYNYYFKNGVLYQDLGNFGTPLNRIYYEPPTTIGKKLGFTTLNEYGYEPDKINFYDTKSPYTKLMYIQGTRGQQSLEAEHTQNIKPNWNVGFAIKRMVALRQVAVGATKEQQMSHYSFNARTSYFSKNKRYAFLFAYTHLDHAQYDYGGILVDSTNPTKADMFEYKLEKPQLYSLPNGRTVPTHLRAYQKSSNFRFYNEYSLASKKGLQLFHQFDYGITLVRYDDDYLYNVVPDYRNRDYYPTLTYDTSHTNDRIVHELYENKVGIKGSAANLFYIAYFRRKDFSYIQTNYEPVNRRFQENFIGGKMEYRFTDTIALSAKGEYYLGRDYLLKFDLTSQFLDVGYTSVSYSPTLLQLRNVSNSYQWENDFSNTYTNSFYANGKLKVGTLTFSPFVSYTTVSKLIYYDTSSFPMQSNGTVNMASIGFSGKVNWKILYLENYLRYTKIGGADVWRAPALFNQSRIYLYGALFKKALRLQLGVDLSWKSGYYGNAYSPAIQQYLLSDRNNSYNFLDGYLLADIFINTQIKRGFVFLKLANANQGLLAPGYFPTPYYSALPRSFEFGIRWLFYD